MPLTAGAFSHVLNYNTARAAACDVELDQGLAETLIRCLLYLLSNVGRVYIRTVSLLSRKDAASHVS